MLECTCGNEKLFYRNISVSAKLKVSSDGEDLNIYDIDKAEYDNYFEPIFCAKCDKNVIE